MHQPGTPLPRGLALALLLLAASPRSLPAHGAPATGPGPGAGDSAVALDAWRRSLEASFPAFRGLRFRKPVQVEYLDRAHLRARLMAIMERENADAQLLAQQKALAAFGFIPDAFDLKKMLVQLHEEEVAGFYDPHSKKLYVIGEGGASGRPVDAEQVKMVLIHEMSHALMDQHYDLERLQSAVRDDDDMSLGLAGLVEGEATLAMLAGGAPEAADRFLRLPPWLMNLLFGLLRPFLAFASGDSFGQAPEILRESMLFPYLKGLPF